MERTNENYLRWRLRRYARDFAPNVAMLETSGSCDAHMEPEEHVVASIASTQDGSPLLVTDVRLIRAGVTLLRHADVRACAYLHREHDVAAELRATIYDRLIIDMKDGREVVLDGLGLAWNPLHRFFLWKLRSVPRQPKAG